ncbi:MAG: SH3 domain-containing protein [Clostridia bacterium]|nr:SH3 domain-containing protein [Clostridia bacterium]
MNDRKTPRILSAILAGILCLSIPAASLAAEYATVQGGGLNLRQCAGLDAKVLGQYGTGTWIEVLEKGETWSKVKVDGKTGYMMTKYLNFGLTGKTMYVRTNTGIGLNLREAPSTSARIITSFPVGTAVCVIQGGDSWHKVCVGKLSGYMASAYLKTEKTSSAAAPATFKATVRNINGGCVVNFRLKPGMKTTILKKIPVGTQVTVLEKGENWCRVEIDGQQGYMSTYMLKF